MNSPIGIGGGFMERDNVEYIERDDSDDEYDEVGVIYLNMNGHLRNFFC